MTAVSPVVSSRRSFSSLPSGTSTLALHNYRNSRMSNIAVHLGPEIILAMKVCRDTLPFFPPDLGFWSCQYLSGDNSALSMNDDQTSALMTFSPCMWFWESAGLFSPYYWIQGHNGGGKGGRGEYEGWVCQLLWWWLSWHAAWPRKACHLELSVQHSCPCLTESL